jgi:hypothetical protein
MNDYEWKRLIGQCNYIAKLMLRITELSDSLLYVQIEQ